MSWNDDHYRKDKNGDFYNQAEIEKAHAAGDVERISGGRYWDKQTGEEYWSDGTKKG